MIQNSDVMIQCEVEAYKLFKALWDEYGQKPTKAYKFYNGTVYVYCLRWLGNDWNSESQATKVFNNLMRVLSTDEYKNVKEYGYKCLQIHENYTFGKFSNFRGDFLFIDFQINIEFNFPEIYSSKEAPDLI